MRNKSYKSITVISIIIISLSFSSVHAQQKQDEPKDTKFYIDRGIAYEEKGQFDQAVDDFTKALEMGSKDAVVYYHRGIGYVNQGQYSWAIDDFNKALEIDPKNAGAYYYRGVTYYFKKRYDESWKDIKKAEDLGYKIPSKFLEKLRDASGRQN
jgi:lipoprotein NlpI